MSSTGIAAPPDTHSSSADTSASAARRSFSIAAYIVGTPSNTVTRSRSMISSALPGSKRGSRVSTPPTAIVALSAQVWPKEWNNGSAPSMTARSSIPKRPTTTSTLRSRFSCVSSAPFGVPVVPDV